MRRLRPLKDMLHSAIGSYPSRVYHESFSSRAIGSPVPSIHQKATRPLLVGNTG
jgi:hypothetical protein